METTATSFKDTFETFITPDMVRGISLGQVTEQYGTAGLYTRMLDSLEMRGMSDNELIQLSLHLGLALHADDKRTNGNYADHLMRVTLRLVEDFNIKDVNLIAAGPLHDAFEDHPRDMVHALTGEKPGDVKTAREIGSQVLAVALNEEIVEIINDVTNPIPQPDDNKLELYTDHTRQLVLNSTKGRVLKLADFIDNAVGNHATMGEKRRRLDEKYIRQYRIHMLGLFLPNSLIVGKERQRALSLLAKGHARALGRLALYEQAG